ncbi:MAG: ABC transporter permease subunit [Oscillospiraceae bacterium]|nr:ABC transporter permease subunit [Oscillospiraceae bacterium]
MPKSETGGSAKALTAILRVFLVAVCLSAFIPAVNPARVSELISKNASLFTCAISYSAIGSEFVRALSMGWVSQSTLAVLYIGALVVGLVIALSAAAFCVSLGNLKMRRLSAKLALGAGLAGLAGTSLLLLSRGMMAGSPEPGRVQPVLPLGIGLFFALFALEILLSAGVWMTLPKPVEEERYEIAAKYRLFLMILPFLVLVTLFAYLPLWGWRYSFFDYRSGFDLSWDTFVGFKWFRYLFSNPATRKDIIRVLKNTFVMSGIGIATSWFPMAFAIFLTELRSNRSKRLVQTFTTIPNFISWVLVYSVAFAIFSTEGFLNWMLINLGVITEGTNYLNSGSHIWLKMWAWGTWKGLGWGAIIYIAAISGIDQQLYEAAMADGANRYRRMWHITVPGLMSTYFVMLLLSIANILSNGMDQYLVFYNPANRNTIQVLDLYVYHLGLSGQSSSNNIPLATLIGMLKSIISVTLLFSANKASKLLRGESIV